MNHIHYLSDNLTICQVPDRLGDDFVVQGPRTDEGSCHVCTDLLFTHNLREYEREQRSSVYISLPPTQSDEDSLAPMRGIMIGLVLGTVLWFLIYLISVAAF